MERPEPAPERPGFVTDLRSSIAAWRAAPMLVVCEGALFAAGVAGARLAILNLAWFAVSLGWAGASRAWYQSVFDGRPLSTGAAIRLLPRYFGRFLRLFLLAMVVLIPIALAFLPFASTPTWLLWVPVAVLGALGLTLLTFVVPELAFSTDRAIQGVRSGIRMIPRTWPACAAYVTVPVAVSLVASTTSLRWWSHWGAASFLLGLVTTLLSLAFDGAIVQFYLRRHDAQLPPLPPPPPPPPA